MTKATEAAKSLQHSQSDEAFCIAWFLSSSDIASFTLAGVNSKTCAQGATNSLWTCIVFSDVCTPRNRDIFDAVQELGRINRNEFKFALVARG